MSQEFNDELISAYLDGELTADQQALVERKLNESREHQQMLNELSALRDSFEALPSYKLDEGFGQRVLRAAEREMLTGNGNTETVTQTVSDSPAPSDDSATPASPLRENRQGWRLAVGSVAAVAAMLLITLFLANQGGEDDTHRNVASQENAAEREEKVAEDNVAPSEVADIPPAEESGGAGIDSQSIATDTPAHGGKPFEDESPAATKVGEKQSVHVQSAAQPKASAMAGESLPQRPAARGITENESFGGSATIPEALDRTQSAGRRANQLSDGGFSGGVEMNYDPGFTEDDFDFVVFLDVPKNQLAARPVEEALRKRNVADAGESRHRGVSRAASDESPQGELGSRAGNVEAGPRPKKKPAEDKESELERVSGSSAYSSDLLVVATFGQIKEVCTDLEERGITATPLLREVNANDAGSNSRLRREQVQQLLQDLPNRDGVESRTENPPATAKTRQEEGDRKRALNLPLPDNGDKPTASKASPPKPAPAAPAPAPAQDSKDKNLVDPKSDTATEDAREIAKHRRTTKPQEADEDAKLRNDAANSRIAAAGQNATVEKANEQPSRDLADKPQIDEVGHSFYRQLGRTSQIADRKESAEKSDVADDSPVTQQQPLAKGTGNRGSQALSAAADSISLDGAQEKTDLSKRVRVRFIIRTVEPSPVSSNAAEEPKAN